MTRKPLQLGLFPPTELPPDPKKPRFRHIEQPVWTENKAKFIQRYLYYFVQVTKHGVYIDAFAGPQRVARPDAWSANLVLEGQLDNFYLRRFYLVELDKNKIPQLETLREKYGKSDKRKIRVDVELGDCNTVIPRFLAGRPIREKEATFALLDQRTFECHWATVQALAQYKTDGHKIELFYFLPNLWLPRAVSRTTNQEKLRLWWGRDDYSAFLRSSSDQRRNQMCARFQNELGYKFVTPFPIFNKREKQIMYYMIHASDHPQASILMHRAYRRVVLPLETAEQLKLDLKSARSSAA